MCNSRPFCALGLWHNATESVVNKILKNRSLSSPEIVIFWAGLKKDKKKPQKSISFDCCTKSVKYITRWFYYIHICAFLFALNILLSIFFYTKCTKNLLPVLFFTLNTWICRLGKIFINWLFCYITWGLKSYRWLSARILRTWRPHTA